MTFLACCPWKALIVLRTNRIVFEIALNAPLEPLGSCIYPYSELSKSFIQDKMTPLAGLVDSADAPGISFNPWFQQGYLLREPNVYPISKCGRDVRVREKAHRWKIPTFTKTQAVETMLNLRW